MTQSLILITTLAIMSGLGVGYWMGYLMDVITEVVADMVTTAICLDIMAESIGDLKWMIKDGRAYDL